MKCAHKTKIGRNFIDEANKMKAKYHKEYGVYVCNHCGGRHLTTKLTNEKQSKYKGLLYRTDKPPVLCVTHGDPQL